MFCLVNCELRRIFGPHTRNFQFSAARKSHARVRFVKILIAHDSVRFAKIRTRPRPRKTVMNR
jgi:hypothetical protein